MLLRQSTTKKKQNKSYDLKKKSDFLNCKYIQVKNIHTLLCLNLQILFKINFF